MRVKELTYVFHPGRSLVFELETPTMPSVAFVHVAGTDDGDIKFLHSDDGESWTDGTTHSLKAKSIQRLDIPAKRYVKILTESKLSVSVLSVSEMAFIELGHEEL